MAVARPPSEFSTFHVYDESAATWLSVKRVPTTVRRTSTGTCCPCVVSRSARTVTDRPTTSSTNGTDTPVASVVPTRVHEDWSVTKSSAVKPAGQVKSAISA